MGSSERSSVVWEGEVLIAELDPDRLDDLEAELEAFVDLDEGEELVVRAPGDDRLEVLIVSER